MAENNNAEEKRWPLPRTAPQLVKATSNHELVGGFAQDISLNAHRATLLLFEEETRQLITRHTLWSLQTPDPQ